MWSADPPCALVQAGLSQILGSPRGGPPAGSLCLFLIRAQAFSKAEAPVEGQRTQVDLWHVGPKAGGGPLGLPWRRLPSPRVCFPRYRVVVSYPPQSEAVELKEDVVFVHKGVRMAGTRGPCRGNGMRDFPAAVESF